MLCPLCPTTSAEIPKEEFPSHLNTFHRQRKGCKIHCPFGGNRACLAPSGSTSAYLKHFYKCHHKKPSSSTFDSTHSSASVSERHVLPVPEPPSQGPSSPDGDRRVEVESQSVCELQNPIECESLPTQCPPSSIAADEIEELESESIFTLPTQCSTSSQIDLEVNHPKPATVSEQQQNVPVESSSATRSPSPECAVNCVDKTQSEIASGQQLVERVTISNKNKELAQRKRPLSNSENNNLEWEDLSDEECLGEVELAFQSSAENSSHKEESVLSEAEDLVLFLRDLASVPQRAVNGTVEHCEKIIKSQLSKFRTLVDTALAPKNIQLTDVMDVPATIDSCAKAFAGIKTKAQQDTYFKKKYNVIKPLRVFLGRQLKRKRRRISGVRETVLVENSVAYNPTLPFLEKITKHPDWKKVTCPSNFSPDKDILDSFMKGERYLNSDFFNAHPDALRIILYYDEFDSCDSLASKAGKHKQGGFYMTFDNVHPKYRSNLDFISLVALVNSSTLKDVGMDMVLKPILQDLKKLEKGFLLPDGQILYASVIAVIGDNLGMHALCGFKEGFTANRTCHHCMVDLHQLRTMTTEQENLLRTADQYDKQVKSMAAATTKKRREQLSSEYGLNRDSCLNELETFSVITSVVADEMHDIWEGSMPNQVKKLLHHLTRGEEPAITLDWLNGALSDFDYEYSEMLNKPSLIRKSHIEEEDGKLHQSSAQMWQLATYLPLILGPHVNDDDKHWINFLELVEISRIVSAPTMPRYAIEYLSDLIESYLTGYIALYGDLIPKQHFLVHYPRLCRLNGPISLYSCMRMEAFHRRFKREAYSIGNYTALSASLSNKHALHQAVVLSKPLISEFEYGPKQKVKLSDTAYRNLLVGSEEVVESLWVKRLGVTYISGRCLVAVGLSDFIVKFARVIHIVVWPELLFICEVATTECFSHHLSAHEIKRENVQALKVFKPSELLGHSVFHSHIIDEKEFIVTKYCINGSF